MKKKQYASLKKAFRDYQIAYGRPPTTAEEFKRYYIDEYAPNYSISFDEGDGPEGWNWESILEELLLE